MIMRKILSPLKTYLLLALLAFPSGSLLRAESLDNPLNFGGDGENGVAQLIEAIVNIVQIISIPIIVFFVIYSGFMYVVARGNPETTKKASKALMYAIIGAVIVLGAQAISIIVADTATSF